MSYDASIYKYCILILLTQFLIIIKAKLIWTRVLTNLKIKNVYKPNYLTDLEHFRWPCYV